MPGETESIAPRSWRQRLGGRWAISLPTYLITGALALVVVLTFQRTALSSWPVAASWALLWLAGTALVGVIPLLVLARTTFRQRAVRPVGVVAKVSADAVAAIVFGLFMVTGASLLNLDMSIAPWLFVLVTSVYATVWGSALTYFLDYRQQVVEQHDRLVEELAAAQILRDDQEELLGRMRAEILAEVDVELGPTRTMVEQALAGAARSPSGLPDTSTQDWSIVANALREGADDAVVPLSREMWQRSSAEPVRQPWWWLLVDVVIRQPFRPLATTVVDSFATMALVVPVFGFTRGMILLAGGVGITVVVMTSANSLMARWPRHHAAIFLTTLILLQATLIFRVVLRETWVPGSASGGWVITQVIAGIIVVFITSGFGALRDRDRSLLASAEAQVRQDEVEARARAMHLAALARETAQHLHGSVQTRLTASAMAIDRAVTQTDDAALGEALQEAIAALTAPMHSSGAAGSVADEVRRKLDFWEGFCDFTVIIDEQAGSWRGSASVVGRVVEEAVSNAVRHGHATRIDVHVTSASDQSLQITIVDHGLGPGTGSPGMGSAYLSQVTAGRWELGATGSGSRLVAYLPETVHQEIVGRGE